MRAATVEIAGVAGSGKSTLARVLCADRGFGGLDDTLRMREPRHLGLVAHSIPRLAYLSKGWIAARRSPTWTELKLVIYLMEWSRRLGCTSEYNSKVMIMDQGPVYAMARLGYADSPIPGTEAHGDWWNSLVDTWADCLDAVIWVDAPNDVLQQRVNTRSQAHEIKGGSEAETIVFTEAYRTSYERVLSAMERPGGPSILRYDTSRLSAADIASSAIEELGRLHPRPGRAASEGGPS
jgi:thymidylate kinase